MVSPFLCGEFFDRLAPCDAFGGWRLVTAFNARLACVAGRTKALEIVEVKRQFRMRSDGLNVIDFEASARAAFDAAPAIAPQSLQP